MEKQEKISDPTRYCTSCGEGQLIAEKFTGLLIVAGEEIKVHNLEGFRCNTCSDEFIYPEQINKNDLTYTDAKTERLGVDL